MDGFAAQEISMSLSAIAKAIDEHSAPDGFALEEGVREIANNIESGLESIASAIREHTKMLKENK